MTILLPADGDNAAIATRRLQDGETVEFRGGSIKIRGTVLEGHRVAAQPIKAGEEILSWGLPFGRALRDIEPGEYLCNARILEILQQRHVDFKIAASANFENRRLHFELDEKTIRAGQQVALYHAPGTFSGFLRENNRGAGTRNFLVVLATSSRANSVVRAVASQFKSIKALSRSPIRKAAAQPARTILSSLSAPSTAFCAIRMSARSLPLMKGRSRLITALSR
jgi:hypothetical protein